MTGTFKSYRQLVAWQCAVELGLEVYQATSDLPASERFGLRSQSRRAAISIAANIAEGYGRGSRREYVHFLHVARGSLRELDTHLLFIQKLGLATPSSLERASHLCDRTGALLDGLIRALRNRTGGTPTHPLPAPRSPLP